MKHAKRLAGLLLALTMVFSLATTAFADEDSGTGSITIQNAAKGETYSVVKLFDASVTGETDGSIVYTGDIPDALTLYFEKENGYIVATAAAKRADGSLSEAATAALKAWAETQTPTATGEGDGGQLVFTNLPYGYYVVTTTQGTAITVDSTNPDATVVDKNSTTPKELVKTVDDDDVSIGDTVTYTVTFKTSNYTGAGTAAKRIVTYTIEDTLPDFLTGVNVTSIIVDNDGNTGTTDDQSDVTSQFVDKKIELDWYDETNGKFLYNNGASVIITYTAVVTEEAAIDGTGNTNTVTLTWTDEDGETDKLEDDETIYTYAIALKKVDDKGEPLSGAVFQFPFYVKATPDTADGAYIYAGTQAGNGLTNQITTPDDGVIVVKGVASGDYSITEVTAPDGYNKLTAPVTITAVKTSETTTHTTVYLDENGNVVETETNTKVEVILENIAAATIVVVNKTGAELPSTGGMGTTIFYTLGSVLMLAAAVLLVTKKRMGIRE